MDPAHIAFGEDPWAWSHRDEKEGITWRLLRRDDLPRVHELWAEMDAKLGRQDKPDQYQMPVLVTLVAVDDATGVIVNAVYGETVVDFTMIGMSRRAARSVQTVFPFITLYLYPRGIRIARVLVPLRMKKYMGRFLPTFADITESFAQFVHKLRD